MFILKDFVIRNGQEIFEFVHECWKLYLWHAFQKVLTFILMLRLSSLNKNLECAPNDSKKSPLYLCLTQ